MKMSGINRLPWESILYAKSKNPKLQRFYFEVIVKLINLLPHLLSSFFPLTYSLGFQKFKHLYSISKRNI